MPSEAANKDSTPATWYGDASAVPAAAALHSQQAAAANKDEFHERSQAKLRQAVVEEGAKAVSDMRDRENGRQIIDAANAISLNGLKNNLMSAYDWIKENPIKSLGYGAGIAALLGGGYWLYNKYFNKPESTTKMDKEASYYLKIIENQGFNKTAAGEANQGSAGSSGLSYMERKVINHIPEWYNEHRRNHPFIIPGAIAAGTGLLSTVASGQTSTGLYSALGALGGYYGGNWLYDNYGNQIEGWVGDTLGKDYVPLTQMGVPIVGALAGSLLGAAFGN